MKEETMYQKMKRRTYEIVEVASPKDKASRAFDICIIILIVLNVFAVLAATFDLTVMQYEILVKFEIISVIVFTIEYVLRVWSSDLIRPEMKPWKARVRYVFSFMALIDLAAIVPFFLPFIVSFDLRILRVLRIISIMRIFKINRYTSAITSVWNVLKRKSSQLLSSMSIIILLMLIASVIMYYIESEAQPETFSNVLDALWWAVATITTVGYGDIYPITAMGRLFSAVIAVLGIGLVAVPTGIISAGFMELIEEEKARAEHEKKYCPFCGRKINN